MKAVSIGGRDVQLDFRAWTDRDRHFGSIVVVIAVAALLVVGIVLQLAARSVADVVLWVLVALVALLFAYEVGAVVWGLRAANAASAASAAAAVDEESADAAAAAETAWRPDDRADAFAPPADEDYADAGAAAAPEDEAASEWAPPPADPEPSGAAAAPASGANILTLRCGECQTEFDVEDSGVRPLYHVCPGCGAEGVLRAERTPLQNVDPARPVERLQKKDDWVPPDLPDPKDIKLRCGACKHVFQVVDNGERPLRHRCPNCGKLGEIR